MLCASEVSWRLSGLIYGFECHFCLFGLLLQRELGVCPGVLACFGFIFWLGE